MAICHMPRGEVGNLAVFIDAGYLFKQGSMCVLGEKFARHELDLDAKEFVTRLHGWLSTEFPADSLLRTYWYDGARRGIATTEQLEVAALPHVKVRLDRVNLSGEQKGVDTLIV